MFSAYHTLTKPVEGCTLFEMEEEDDNIGAWRYASYSSSNIASSSYNPASQTLRITFHQGRTYTYEGVPEEVAEGLEGASSPGRYFHANIAGGYDESEG